MCVWKSSGRIWLLPISKKYFFHLVDIVTSNSKFFKKLSWWIHGMTFKHGWIRSWFLISWSWSHSWRLSFRQILNNWKCRLFAFKSSASWRLRSKWTQSFLSKTCQVHALGHLKFSNHLQWPVHSCLQKSQKSFEVVQSFQVQLVCLKFLQVWTSSFLWRLWYLISTFLEVSKYHLSAW